MPVTRAGVGYTAQKILGGSASGTVTATVHVSTNTTDKYGIVAVGWVGDTAVNSSTFTPTWNGDAMTPLCNALLVNSNKTFLRGWIVAVDDADEGDLTVSLAYGSIPTGLLQKNCYIAAECYANVEAIDMASIAATVVTAVGSTSVGSQTLTVPSGVPADRVISAHLVGKLRNIDAFTGVKVAAPHLSSGGQLVVGETRGATSTPVTASFNANTNDWAAFGVSLSALPLQGLGFSSTLIVGGGTFGADLYRYAEPHPDRDYMVPPVGSSDVTVIAGANVRNAGGVDMPVWVKDPDAVLDYTLRWNNHLAPDDELTHVEHTAQGSVQIISELINPDNKAMTQFWAKGGTPGVTHPVRVRLTTKHGRVDDFTAFIAGANN